MARVGRGTVLGAFVVAAYATVALAVVVDEVRAPRAQVPVRDARAAEQFLAAWERGRTAAFVVVGTVERSSEATGASLVAEEITAQRPPRRLVRAFGGVEGRVDDRVLVCPAGPNETTGPCSLGPPGGPTYEESVEAELAALVGLITGTDPLYAVVARPDGCFELDQRRLDPRAPYGRRATFCFDPATGAPTGRRVLHEAGVVEVFTAVEVRAEVTDADLEP